MLNDFQNNILYEIQQNIEINIYFSSFENMINELELQTAKDKKSFDKAIEFLNSAKDFSEGRISEMYSILPSRAYNYFLSSINLDELINTKLEEIIEGYVQGLLKARSNDFSEKAELINFFNKLFHVIKTENQKKSIQTKWDLQYV